MAALPRIPRTSLGRVNLAPMSVGSSSVRAFSTTTYLGHASPPSKNSKAPLSASRSHEAQNRPSQARRSSLPSPTIRVTPTPNIARSAPSSANSSNPNTPRPTQEALHAAKEQEAIRAAERREATLRVARLKRADQREAEAIELAKKEKAKAEYEKRSNTMKRIWTISFIMMPIILVTSYRLFDRFVLGNPVKPLPEKTGEDDG